MQIHILKFDNAITVYWDKSLFGSDERYRAFIDGTLICETDKTHFTVYDLIPGVNYLCSLQTVNGRILWKETVSTLPKKKRIDVTKAPYFAIGDGKTMNTEALQRAFDDCGSDSKVYIPNGVFMSGALNVHSETEIYLEEGAVLQGSTAVEDYEPKIRSRFEGLEMECYRSLINIGTMNRDRYFTAVNVTLRGKGTISGGGLELFDNIVAREKVVLQDYMDSLGEKLAEYECAETIPGRARGRLINISSAKNVVIADLKLQNSPSWNVHMIYSEDIVTYGCSFESLGIRNGDGWNPDSSVNCTLFGSVFNVGDDCIALKSGKNPEGNIINRPTKNVDVFDCISIVGHGIALGSEVSGGIENVRIWDCDFRHSEFGLHLKTTPRRGGYVKNISVKDSILPNITIETVSYNDDGESADSATVFENITLTDVYLTGLSCYENGDVKESTAIAVRDTVQNGYVLKSVVLEDVKIRDNYLTRLSDFESRAGFDLKNVELDK
ncbi:MAG: glycoside hydrolase family 28 protein [Eubacteriales bacterium]